MSLELAEHDGGCLVGMEAGQAYNPRDWCLKIKLKGKNIA